MANSINTNIAAYYAQANITLAANASSLSVARLSSGNRIVRAADDVAALATGSSLTTNVSTLKVAIVNAAQGTSLLQVADGALSQITEILQRQKAIALQAGSGSLADTDRAFLNQEFQALVDEIDRIAGATNFNGVNLIDGSLSGVSGNFTTDDPAAFGDFLFTIPDAADPSISAAVAVAAVDATNGLNPSVIGDITNVTYANVGAADDGTAIRVRFEVNGVLFEGVADFTDFDTTDDNETVAVTMTEVGPTFNDSHGATNDPMQLTITFQEQTGGAVIAGLATFLSHVGTDAEAALEGTYITQTRVLAADVTDSVAGTALEGIADNSVEFNTFLMDTITGDTYGSVESVSVVKVGDSTDSNGQITVRINGKDFSLFDLEAATTAGILSTGTLTLTHTDGETARTETVTIDLTGLDATINLNTDQGAAAFETALSILLTGNDVSTGGGLSFQIGTSATDTLTVSIASATTTEIYGGETLDVLSQSNASAAGDVLDDALAAITALRAGVGALQSRFNFASTNIQISVQNQDAARGALLDTDIAAESTTFATSQVKLQAGISVLAQANQQLQSLLKLIG